MALLQLSSIVDLSSESFYEWQFFLGRIPESLYDRHSVKGTLVYYGKVAKRRKGTGLAQL